MSRDRWIRSADGDGSVGEPFGSGGTGWTTRAASALAASILVGGLLGCSPQGSPSAPRPPLEQASASGPVQEAYAHLVATPRSASDLAGEMQSGALTSEALTEAYLARIRTVDDAGPTLNAVIAVNPDALAIARALDEERASGAVRGRLHGVPILVKDNIETLDPMATTAGSLALAGNLAERDAAVIARLREAGAVILGKANLSEWANFRSQDSTSGWSAVGGLVKNPHALQRSACGSSSGSGAAVAAGLAAAAIGTETDGSVVCPSAANGVVGIKPTVGLVSRAGIIPISASQDTAGPMALTVADAALLLAVMAGTDPSDPATAEADARREDYTAALDSGALAGARIGVARFLAGYHPPTDAVFDAALKEMEAAGAVLVDIDAFPARREVSAAEWIVLKTEFKAGLNAYLATTPETVTTRTLDELIAFNAATPAELKHFDQSIFIESAAAGGLDDPDYLAARERGRRLAGPEGIDRLLADNDVVAMVAPTGGPAWTADLVTGDHFLGGASGLAAVAGYPHITVPMGGVKGVPVGLSFFGAAWSESRLIGLAYAFEQRTKARLTPTFALPDLGELPLAR
ncbi:amidase [bacterium]|nr:amidase [bacterium]